jgi:Zn-dependent peptidase ImmA (M78 family)/transcriptional regulator with XRE-family HTH domain
MDGFSAKNLGTRLRAAREAANLSTRVAARRLTELGLPLSHTMLANYELGSAFPTTPAVQSLARIYNKPYEWFLSSGPSLSGVRYRSLKSVKASDKQAFEGAVAAWTQVYVELENILEQQLSGPQCIVGPDEDGKALADRLRAELGLGENPIPSVVELLEQFGIRVIQVRSEARIDGLAAMFGDVRVVALNDTLPNDRFRFNAGHELGHHLFEDCLDGSDEQTDEELDPRAHDFASNLLLPDEKLREAFQSKSMVRLVQFKERYGISLAAMIYRARKKNYVSAELYERLWREFSRLGWRKDEPGHVKPDRPTRMEQLIETAVSSGRMSYGDVARIGGLPEADVRAAVRRANGAGSIFWSEGEES